MKVEYCIDDNPFTCIMQTIFGLIPFGSLFYFNWIASKYIKAEGYTQSIPSYTKSHIYKLLGSILVGAFSLVRIILEIAQNEDQLVILSYIIYASFVAISCLLTYHVRQEYVYLGYTTPFMRTFIVLFECCYAIMLVLSEVFPGSDSVNGFTVKEAFQILIIVDIFVFGIVCFAFKSDTNNPSHVEIADLGFKLKKVYSSDLLQQLNPDQNNSQIYSGNDPSKQYLQKNIMSEYLSQNSNVSHIKTIQSNDFSMFDGRNRGISELNKIKLENVGVQSIKVMLEERKKDPESQSIQFTFKIQVKTKTDEIHETVRNLNEFINYINDIKLFLNSIKYIQEQVISFDQTTKNKALINQLTSNLGKILKFVVENDYINSRFYELTRSNFEQAQYGKEPPKTPTTPQTPLNTPSEPQNAAEKSSNIRPRKKSIQKDKTSQSERNKNKGKSKQKKPEDTTTTSEQTIQKEENQIPKGDQTTQSLLQENTEVNVKETLKQDKNEKDEEEKLKTENKKVQNKNDANEDKQEEVEEESKENPSELPINIIEKLGLRQSGDKSNEFERSLSYHVSRNFEPVHHTLKQFDEESNPNHLVRTSSIAPQENQLRGSLKIDSSNQKQQQQDHKHASLFFQVQFLESKIVDSYAVYVFKIKERKANWEITIEKRYSQFEKLHSLLKPIAKSHKIILPGLPYKNSDSGMFTSGRDQALIKFRSSELKKYLQKLLIDKTFNKEQLLMEFIGYSNE